MYTTRRVSIALRLTRNNYQDSGFGIIESVIAVLVLSVVVITLGSFLSGISRNTGGSSLEVTSAGLGRQELTYWQQQLASDSVDDFPSPLPCAWTNDGQSIGASICPGENIFNVVSGDICAPAICTIKPNPAYLYSYCSPLGSDTVAPSCTVPTTVPNPTLSSSSFTIVTAASWQCNYNPLISEGSDFSSANKYPSISVKVSVTWPQMNGMSPVVLEIAIPAPTGIVVSEVDKAGTGVPAWPQQATAPQTPSWPGVPSQSSTFNSNTGNNSCLP